jgi:hypothetical protein
MNTPGSGILTVTLSLARELKVGETALKIRYEAFGELDVRKRWLIYAILECGSAQVYSEALFYSCTWGKTTVVWPRATTTSWGERNSRFGFDVSISSELTVDLFDRKPTSPAGHQVTLLGCFNRDTNRVFVINTIQTPGVVLGNEIVQQINHPFLAPFEFDFKLPEGTSLLSPIGSGGHLFSYLQRE